MENQMDRPVLSIKQQSHQPEQTPKASHPYKRPSRPPGFHTREFEMPDGRRVVVDHRSIGMVFQEKNDPEGCCLIAPHLAGMRPFPVKAKFDDVRARWTGRSQDDAPRGHETA
jgi:hypothetical protein